MLFAQSLLKSLFAFMLVGAGVSNQYSSFECSRRQVSPERLEETVLRGGPGLQGEDNVSFVAVFEVDLHPHSFSQTDALP